MASLASKDESGSFESFTQLCLRLGDEPSYNQKEEIIKRYVEDEFTGDLFLLCKLLLCKEDKRVYNVRDKQGFLPFFIVNIYFFKNFFSNFFLI